MSGAYLPLRILLGAMCVFFAHWLGRALAGRARQEATNAQVMRWALRVLVTALGAAWGGIDWTTIIALALAVASGGFGYYLVWRPRPPKEDLARRMFPDE